MEFAIYIVDLILEAVERKDAQNILNAFVQMLLQIFNFVLDKMDMSPIELEK